MKHLSEMDLIELAAGRTPQAQQQAWEAHIARCPECQSRREAMVRLWQRLGVIEAPQMEMETEEVVGRALQQSAAPVRLRWHAAVSRMLRIAAAMLLAAGTGHLAGRMTWKTAEADPTKAAEHLYLTEVFGHGANRLAGTMQRELPPSREETNG